MKNLMLLVLIFLAVACNSKEEILILQTNEEMCEAAIAEDAQKVDSLIKVLTIDLVPVATPSDPLGQQANLNTLIDRLNEADCMEATLGCYACMESFPLQSAVDLTITRDGEQFSRSLRLFTSENEPLYFSSID